MLIKEIKCKACMVKSKLTDYVINPYTGCQHSCCYCYADFIRRFQNIKENWGDFVHVKINCPELLEKELEKNKAGHIWMSSVCDCYMPVEGKYKLTRKILETILNSKYKNKFTIETSKIYQKKIFDSHQKSIPKKWTFEILTKSALVKRDFDLLKKLDVELGMSINTLSNEFSRIIEPFASSPLERIKTLKEAKAHGIKVYVFISPVLPGITNLEELFKELNFCEYAWIELLNTKPSVLQRLMPIIKEKFPQFLEKFDFAINNPEEYYQNIKKQVAELEKKYKLKVKEIVRHE